eukprot:m.297362 g.297362  ORF g.297362 m.297362 type:complete len:359 (+) comp16398_c0_seq1:155-1231(+)
MLAATEALLHPVGNIQCNNKTTKATKSPWKSYMVFLIFICSMIPKMFSKHDMLMFATMPSDKKCDNMIHWPSCLLGKALQSTVPTNPEASRRVKILYRQNTSTQQIEDMIANKQAFLLKGSMKKHNINAILESLGHTKQNVFKACKHRPAPYLQESAPCRMLTLNDRISELREHQRAGAPMNGCHVHNLAGSSNSWELLEDLLFKKLEASEGIRAPIQEQTFAPIIGVFYAQGNVSAVPNLHMHPDAVLTHAIEGTKIWRVAHPDYAPLFNPLWSGVSLVARSIPKRNSPLQYITQEPGDLLFLPPWYLHSTSFPEDSLTSIGFNTHFQVGALGFVSGVMAEYISPDFFFTYLMPLFK